MVNWITGVNLARAMNWGVGQLVVKEQEARRFGFQLVPLKWGPKMFARRVVCRAWGYQLKSLGGRDGRADHWSAHREPLQREVNNCELGKNHNQWDLSHHLDHLSRTVD